MCRTVHALLQTVICGIQMLVRVFMTVILMIENLIRMVLQTLYNFISFLLQMISLIPICVVFLVTARLKCFMCGGGGPCPVNRGGTCDCLMSALAFIILFFIFRATGVLDKIFYSLGYAKALPVITRFVPTPGDITECSRNDSETTQALETTDAITYASTTEIFTEFLTRQQPYTTDVIETTIIMEAVAEAEAEKEDEIVVVKEDEKVAEKEAEKEPEKELEKEAEPEAKADAILTTRIADVAKKLIRREGVTKQAWTTVFYYFV